jgi:hypothetical protein
MDKVTESPDGGDAGVTDLVTRLREDELQNLRAQLNGGSCEVALKNLDERGIAQELIGQQYSGRYPFELLQNADDAAAERTDGVEGVARFVVTDSALIVADMGLGFGDRQIRAICSLGRTSKDPRKTIGYKGLGFKSVEEITDRPQVVSGSHRFMFDRTQARQLIAEITGPLDSRQRVPVYAYPLPIGRTDLGEDAALVDELIVRGFRTVIRLPLRAGVTRAEVSRDVGLIAFAAHHSLLAGNRATRGCRNVRRLRRYASGRRRRARDGDIAGSWRHHRALACVRASSRSFRSSVDRTTRRRMVRGG